MKKRRYRMRTRAIGQEQTRQRIVEAAVALHRSLGPSKTSISAVAKEAGVQRLTVYRHFDEASLFSACSGHWLSQNPPPDAGTWSNTPDPAKRTELALLAFYRYYRVTADMLTRVYRDLDEVDGLRAPVEAFQRYLDQIRDDLLAAWCPVGRKPQTLSAAIAHALSFTTWSSLSGLGFSDARISRLVLGWIAATAGQSARAPTAPARTARR